MKIEEAIDLLNCFPEWNEDDQWLDYDRMEGFVDVANKSLKKQIPMRVKEQGEFKNIHASCAVCPSCGSEVVDYFAKNYCPNCGQRILWRDETWKMKKQLNFWKASSVHIEHT